MLVEDAVPITPRSESHPAYAVAVRLASVFCNVPLVQLFLFMVMASMTRSLVFSVAIFVLNAATFDTLSIVLDATGVDWSTYWYVRIVIERLDTVPPITTSHLVEPDAGATLSKTEVRVLLASSA